MTAYRLPKSLTCLAVWGLLSLALGVSVPQPVAAQEGDGGGGSVSETSAAVSEVGSDIVLDETEAVIPEELEEAEEDQADEVKDFVELD